MSKPPFSRPNRHALLRSRFGASKQTVLIAGLLAGCGVIGGPAWQGASSIPPVSAEDASRLPKGEDQLSWTVEQKVVAHRNMNVIFPSDIVKAGGTPYPLPRNVDPLKVTYSFDGSTRSIDDYFDRTNVTGLLVIKNGKVVFEKYAKGYQERNDGSSRSMAKSFAGVLVGAAVKDGYIQSVDDPVSRYMPELVGTMYESISIRQMMQMTSGVPYRENPADPTSDVFPLQACLVKNQRGCLASFVRDLGARKGAVPKPAGTVFNYSTADAALIGILVERATGRQDGVYLSEKIWKPFGMEQDGYWNVEAKGGNTFGGSGFGATLRDYGRFGLYLMRQGVLPDGSQSLPDGWMTAALKPTQASISAGRPYGFFLWLPQANGGTGFVNSSAPAMRGAESVFYAVGSSGQNLVVNPTENVVIVKWAAWGPPMKQGADNEDFAMFSAIVDKLH